ncbi:MAG: hypothetical protein VCD31_07890 [Alphaproteobacteria bacterium]
MRYNRGIFLSIAAIAAFLSLAARATAQNHSGHEGHDMAAMMSVGEDGSWSYAGRDYPKMLLHGRWETIPVAGRAGAAVSAEGMTLQARCGALMASQNLMHDRATQAACRSASQPGMAEKREPMHQDHDMGDDGGGQQH